MNLLRVMPAEGSGLPGFVSGCDEWSKPLFRIRESGFFCDSSCGVMEKSMEIEIRINGREERRKACSIAELVAGRGLTAGSLIVEHNGRIIKQDDWGEVMLGQGDVLEMLNFVGGG